MALIEVEGASSAEPMRTPRTRSLTCSHHPLPVVLLSVARPDATVPPTARAESGREVSSVCPWQARSAIPDIPAGVSARSPASGVSIAVSRVQEGHRAALRRTASGRVSARTKVIRRPMVPDSSLAAGAGAGLCLE